MRAVLALRRQRAAILEIGGDYRRALPEFDALARTYLRVQGPAGTDALECAQLAAYCRAELGDNTAALDQFRDVLTRVRAARGDADAMALEIRRSIGLLLLSEARTEEAVAVLQPLYDDLRIVNGDQDENTLEVLDLLTRIRATPAYASEPPTRDQRIS